MRSHVPLGLARLPSGHSQVTVDTVHFGARRMIAEKDVSILTKFGEKLTMNVFRPESEEPCPVVMAGSVYGKDGEWGWMWSVPGVFPSWGVFPTSDLTPFEAPDPGFWVPNGYAVIMLGLRGSSGSDGPIQLLGDGEARGYADAIEWAAAQPWSNGRVGLNGVSYLAMTQWRVAALRPAGLRAMIPWEGMTDVYRDLHFHGGIPETQFTPTWRDQIASLWPTTGVEDVVAAQTDHPLDDEYWASKRADLAQIEAPMLVGASWSTQGLHNRGTLEGFKQAGSDQKWLVVHGRKEWETYYARESLELQRRFFDRFLKGDDNGWEDRPVVEYERRERFYQGERLSASSWPLPDVKPRALYLSRNHRLSTVAGSSSDVVSYEPTKVEGPTFSAQFNESTEVTGPMSLRLWVDSPGSADMDLFVAVKKLDKHGRPVHLADMNHAEGGRVASGWLRVSHREVDVERSTDLQPWLKHRRLLPLHDEGPVQVDIEIMPSSTLFRAGEFIHLTVSGTDIPHDASPGLPVTAQVRPLRHTRTVNGANHRLHFGGQYASRLLLPVVMEHRAAQDPQGRTTQPPTGR